MNKFLKILLIVLGVIVSLIILTVLFLFWLSKQPAVAERYWEKVTSDKILEQKYTNPGDYETASFVKLSDDEKIGQFKIWYPAGIEETDNTCPAVVMVNGTGVPA